MEEYVGVTIVEPIIYWHWTMILWAIPIVLILWALVKEFLCGGK